MRWKKVDIFWHIYQKGYPFARYIKLMENAKKGRKFVSIKNSTKWKPKICAKFSFQKSRFSEKRNCRNLPLIHMAHIINTARIKQRSVIITLLDLKNAFGELHHNLIYEVLQYHHLPREISDLIQSLYTNFRTSIITEQFGTPFIAIGRGVLQGDCLSPLLFNMSFNTFIQHIKSEKYSQLGFWKFNKYGIPCNPIHWFQFADDAAVNSSQEKENQILLNRFSVWCQWANMIIRVDKCSSFGIKKHLSKSIQYQPKLFVNNQLIPRIEIGKSFCYLGRYFDFNMSDCYESKCEWKDSRVSVRFHSQQISVWPRYIYKLFIS